MFEKKTSLEGIGLGGSDSSGIISPTVPNSNTYLVNKNGDVKRIDYKWDNYSFKEWLETIKGLKWEQQTFELLDEFKRWVGLLELSKSYEVNKPDMIDALFTIKVNGRVLSSEDWVKDTGHKMRSSNENLFPGELDMFKDWALHRKSEQGVMCPPDMVNHPDHYKTGGIETLDFVRAKLNSNTAIDHWQAYCFGNAMKYISRAGMKGDLEEDIKKAIFYLRSSIGDDPR